MTPIKINKKEIKKINFPEEEVLQSNKKKRFRKLKLKSAVVERARGSKYRITFKSAKRGYFTVISKILVAEKDYAILSGGYIIPTNAITEIK